MAEHTLTPDEIAMIDATVARVRADRADAQIMGAKYDGACEQIVKLLDEATAQWRRIAELEHEASRLRADYDEATAELAQELAEERTLTGRLRLAWTSARRRAAQQRDALRDAVAADRNQARRVRDRYRGERDTARAESAALRAQLAATTAPHRAEERLAADARPTGGGQ